MASSRLIISWLISKCLLYKAKLMRKLIIKHFKISKNYYILRDIKVFSKKFFRLSPFVIMEIGAQGVEGACMRPVITPSCETGPSPLQTRRVGLRPLALEGRLTQSSHGVEGGGGQGGE